MATRGARHHADHQGMHGQGIKTPTYETDLVAARAKRLKKMLRARTNGRRQSAAAELPARKNLAVT